MEAPRSAGTQASSISLASILEVTLKSNMAAGAPASTCRQQEVEGRTGKMMQIKSESCEQGTIDIGLASESPSTFTPPLPPPELDSCLSFTHEN